MFAPISTKFVLPVLAAASGLVLLASCDGDNGSGDPATLRLAIEAVAAGAVLQANQPFTVNGRKGALEIARLYLSDLTLLHEDGREIRLEGDTPITVRAKQPDDSEIQHTVTERYVLVKGDAGRTLVPVGDVPAGRYTGVRFTLGVNGLDNRIAMEDAPAGHPLAPQTPSMHWSWNSGYVFLRLDGLLDVDGDGTPDPATGTPGEAASGQWRLHVGGADNAPTVTLATPFALEGGAAQDLHLQVDFAKFVSGVDYGVAANRFCMTGGCQPLVDAARAGAAAAFALHGVHHD